MRRVFASIIFAILTVLAYAQSEIKVEAPDVVGLDEQFNLVFSVEGKEDISQPDWNPGEHFQLVWGPQRGHMSSTQIINGKRTSSSKTSFTYVLIAKETGTFTIPAASFNIQGKSVSSKQISIKVVKNESSGGQSSSSSDRAAATGDISSEDLFMTFSLSKSNAVIGEPLYATLKICQRVNIAGFENAKFPTFNGFWSQETETPSNIEFKRESIGDKIYNTAVLRRYVLVPQQAGKLQIDPAELVVLVNVRVPSSGTGSIFDSFFGDDYRTLRKRVSTKPVTVNVKALPAAAPASFGGGVGSFEISSKIGKDSLKTHEAASLFITVKGKGNVALIEAPQVKFPADFEVYDIKTTDNTDKSYGGTSGSKTFEYPFIPRSHGDFTIGPVEYSYYDSAKDSYVSLKTEPIEIKVLKGQASTSSSVTDMPLVERRGVRNLAEDIRFIHTGAASFKTGKSYFVSSTLYWLLLALLALLAAAAYYSLGKIESRRADIAGTRNRKAVKMALSRLKKAGDFLSKDLQAAFYEELHKALLGFCADKLNIGAEDLNKDNISAMMLDRGGDPGLTEELISLIDACEYARYAPKEEAGQMKSHYDTAVSVISSLDTVMKRKSVKPLSALIILAFLSLTSLQAQDYRQSWEAGVQAYQQGQWEEAAASWTAIADSGIESPDLYYNIGNACYKSGNVAKAILYYEKSLKLDPSHKDAAFNLEYANSNIQDRIDSLPAFFLTEWVRGLSRILSSNAWAVLSLLFFALTLILIILFAKSSYVRARKAGFFGAMVSVLLFAGTFALSYSVYKESVRKDAAIIMSAVASVKSSPSADSAKDLFVLHEGTKVIVLQEVGEWLNVELADGRQGWIKSGNLETI